MACILMPECNFMHGYFRCLLPEATMDVEVKVKMMRGIHTFRRDHTHPGHSCKPWSSRLHPYPIPDKENADLPGIRRKPGNQLHTSTYWFGKTTPPWMVPTPKRTAEWKKRTKTTMKRWFKVRLIEKSLPELKATATMATSTPTSVVNQQPLPPN